MVSFVGSPSFFIEDKIARRCTDTLVTALDLCRYFRDIGQGTVFLLREVTPLADAGMKFIFPSLS